MTHFPFAILGFALGLIAAYIYENLPLGRLTGKKALIVFGHRLHHSLYGLLLILSAFLLSTDPSTKVLLISAGIGVLVEHYITGGGLDFITKE